MTWTQVFWPKCHTFLSTSWPFFLLSFSDKPFTKGWLTSTLQSLTLQQNKCWYIHNPESLKMNFTANITLLLTLRNCSSHNQPSEIQEIQNHLNLEDFFLWPFAQSSPSQLERLWKNQRKWNLLNKHTPRYLQNSNLTRWVLLPLLYIWNIGSQRG